MKEDFNAVIGTLGFLLSKPMKRLVYWLYLVFVIILIGGSQILNSIWVYYGNESVFGGSSQLSQNLFSFYITIFVSFFFIIKQKIKILSKDYQPDKDYGESIIYLIIGFIILISGFLILKTSLPSWVGWIFYAFSLLCWTISVSDDEFINKEIKNIQEQIKSGGGFTNNN